MISLKEFNRKMSKEGYVIFPEIIDMSLVDKMRDHLDRAYRVCRKIQMKNGVENSEGTCHHLVGQYVSFMECLDEYEALNPYLESYFQGMYILNSFGGNILRESSYANDIHRDIRTHSGTIPLMLNSIVMLDDFTSDNGATWVMAGGHTESDIPPESYFDSQAVQLIAPAGSIALFNSNMWHRAGINRTSSARRSVTPIFCKPFMKQGFDYPRALGECRYGTYLKQVLGYNSRTPQTLYDWYQPKEKRFYRSDQG